MKKYFNNQGCFKKVLGLFLVAVTFCLLGASAKAKMLTIDEVSKEFNQSSTVKDLSELGVNISTKVNTTDSTIDVYNGDEKIISAKYTDDYIEYDNRDVVVTKDNCTDDLGPFVWIYGTLESILTLSGYENKTLISDETYTDTYDTYGLQIETEKFSFSEESEDGSSWGVSGNFTKYFKVSLDTDKIDALVAKYGTDIEKEDSAEDLIKSLIPELEAKDITENSVTLYPKIASSSASGEDSIFCNVYRSNSKDGDYEKLSEFGVNCLEEVGITDEKLKSGTTYYYKTIVMGGTTFSEPLEITTKSSKETAASLESNEVKSDENKSEIENPNTGVNIPVITISLLLIVAITIICYTKKKSIFKRI